MKAAEDTEEFSKGSDKGALNISKMAVPLRILSSWIYFLSLVLKSAKALFVRPPYSTIPYPQLQLNAADALGIPYKGIAYDAGKSASLPGFALSLNAEFGPIEESTFARLKSAYGSWSETKSKVVWKEGRSYTLLDFLPPLFQAVSGLHFRSSRTKLKGLLPSFIGGPNDRARKYTEQEILLTSNCWGFAWEALFQADNSDTSRMTISTADPTSAWRQFTGGGFDLIQSSRTAPTLLDDAELRNRRTKAGDVLLIWHKNPSTASGQDLYLDHVATLIDNDVYFEKSGSGDKVPFRINTWEGLTKNFPLKVFFWEWRRLVRNNPLSPSLYGSPDTRLLPATDVFGLDAQLQTTAVQQIDRWSVLSELQPNIAKRFSLQTDIAEDGFVEGQTYTGILVLEDLLIDPETGRASLPKSAFQKDWFARVLQQLPKNNK